MAIVVVCAGWLALGLYVREIITGWRWMRGFRVANVALATLGAVGVTIATGVLL